jgi:hypothetical protein
MSPDLNKYIKEIAKIYGVKVKFNHNSTMATYWKGKITLGTKGTDKYIIDLFCHELGHYKNDLEGVFSVYHREEPRVAIKKMGALRYCKYALKAEVYTEKIGKDIAKIWFPNHKYKITYKNNSYYLGFFYGYYLPESF